MAKAAVATETPDVLIEQTVEAGILTVRLNRPERRNAVNNEVTRRLADVVKRAETDPQVRVVILTGGTGCFCAGADLEHVSKHGFRGLATDAGGFAGFVFAQRKTPWIAAVEGPAMGGGFELALACDFIVASRTAVFSLAEVKRGLAAFGGGMFRVHRTLPRVIANEVLATGDPLDAPRAERFGLVNTLTDPGDAMAAALTLARKIRSAAPLSVEESLSIGRDAHALSDADLIARSRAARDRLFASKDAREGIDAFLARRAPHWQGQ